MMPVPGCLAQFMANPNFGTSTQVQDSSILDISIIFEKSFCLENYNFNKEKIKPKIVTNRENF